MAMSAAEQPDRKPLVQITVNKKPVNIAGPRVTGLQIKEAAIAQGVAIQPSFQLSQELSDRQRRIVGDNDVVTVHKGSKFFAVAGDDNS
jgi:hypothetical protein